VSIWSRVARWPTGEPGWLPLAAALQAPLRQITPETGPGLLSSLLAAREPHGGSPDDM
jgi:hypothetical protein